MISPDCRGRCAALALSCVLLALGCAGVGRGSLPAEGEPLAIDPEMTVRRIAPDAFVVTHEPAFASNVLVVRMPDGSLVLCSSPLDTVATRKMLRWARETFAPTRMVAINPHYHPDGTAGNEAYAESGVETWATDHTRRLLADHGARVRDEAAASLDDPVLAARVRDTRITPAAHTIPADEPYTLTIGGEEVRVIPPGPAHSPDNVVILFPARGILFGGCMIKAGRSIGNTLDADLGNWEAAVRAIEGLGARLIVPGHGAVGGVELLGNTIEVVRAERARDPVAVVRKELEARYAENMAGFMARDPDRVMRLWHPDFHTITPDGRVSSREQMYQRTRDFIGRIERFDSLSETIIGLTLEGDTAHAIVDQRTVRRQRLGDGSLHEVRTSVVQRESWVRTPEGWLLWRVDEIQPGETLLDGKPVP